MKGEQAISEGKLESGHDGGDAYDRGQGACSSKQVVRQGSETQTVDTNRNQLLSNEKSNAQSRSMDERTSKHSQGGSGEDKPVSPLVGEPVQSLGEKKPRKLVGTGVKKLTKHGRYTSDITLEEMERYYHLPAYEAARRMGIGLTILKRLCRKFGVQRWPYQRRRFADMEEDELLRSYNLIQKKAKKEEPRQHADEATDKNMGVDKAMVDLIIYTIRTMYSPKEKKYDQKELIDGLGGCITKLVEVLQEMNRRLAMFNQQTRHSVQQGPNHQSSSSRQESPMDILHQLFRSTQAPPESMPQRYMPDHSYHPHAGSSMLSSQYGLNNHDVQSGFTPYRTPYMNTYGEMQLQLNQMNNSTTSDHRLLEILRKFQGGSGMSGTRQQEEEK